MTDEEFINKEIEFKHHLAKFIEACVEWDCDVKDRVEDCVFDALNDAGIE